MSLDILGPASAPGAVTTRPTDTRAFGAADTFFRDCSSATLDDGTEFQAAWFNQVTAILRAIVRSNGQTGGGVDVVTQDNADDGVLLKAVQHLVQRGQITFGTDVGTADAMVVSLSPAPAEYKNGMQVWVKKAASPNATTTPTLAVNALAAKTIVKRDGVNAPAANDFVASGWYGFGFDGTNWRSLTSLPSDSISAAGVKQLIFQPNIVKFTTPGSFSWPVPAGVTIAKIIAWGAGAGGGFSATSGGSGGGGGGYGEQTVTVTPGGTLSGVVGAGGAAATSIAANGAGGGNTTITNSTGGVTYTAQGGVGGGSGNGLNNSSSGGGLINFADRALIGQPSGGTIMGTFAYAGNGGAAALGGVPGLAGTGGGNSGNAPGSGGGGSGNAQPAGAGARGEVWILF